MSFHLFYIDEAFSSADGSVQFIELTGYADGQEFWGGRHLTVTQGSTVHDFLVPNDLPSSQTNGHTVLLATAGFAALTGVTPDYTIPANFLFTPGSGTVVIN